MEDKIQKFYYDFKWMMFGGMAMALTIFLIPIDNWITFLVVEIVLLIIVIFCEIKHSQKHRNSHKSGSANGK